MAYWYQTEPHVPFAPLPAPDQRISKAPLPFHEEGAREMENMIDGFKGGPLEKQDMGAYGDQWSAGWQLFFRPSAPLAYSHTFTVKPAKAGQAQVELWYASAPDYGICEIWLNGAQVARWDGYDAQGVKRGKTEFPLTLKAGDNTMEIRIVGKNPASKGYYAGLDCFRMGRR